MRIKAKISQSWRDFTADYECEFCGHVWRGTGYDDMYFHREVVPAMVCSKCHKSSGVLHVIDVYEGEHWLTGVVFETERRALQFRQALNASLTHSGYHRP